MNLYVLRLLSLLPQFIYKRIIKKLKPPIEGFEDVVKSSVKIKENLFDGNSKNFVKFHKDCNIYAEYGCGLSTLYSVNSMEKKTLSVDTDQAWVEKILKHSKNKSLLNIQHVDLGATGNWGMPQNYLKRNNIKIYLKSLWAYKEKPDFILIDGRFRVASFLTSLKYASKDAIICFDDYVDREIYHIVEEFEKPFLEDKRQAYFKVKGDYDLKFLDFTIENLNMCFLNIKNLKFIK